MSWVILSGMRCVCGLSARIVLNDTFSSVTRIALKQRHATGGTTVLFHISAYVSMRKVASYCAGRMAEGRAGVFHPSDLLTSLTKGLPPDGTHSGTHRRHKASTCMPLHKYSSPSRSAKACCGSALNLVPFALSRRICENAAATTDAAIAAKEQPPAQWLADSWKSPIRASWRPLTRTASH